MRTFNHLSSQVVRSLSKILGSESVDFWLTQANVLDNEKRCLARVSERIQENGDTVSLILQPNALFKGFESGQHLNVSVNIEGVVYNRSYSFSAAPSQKGELQITVKKTPNGKVSTHLCEQVQVGDLLELGQAFGDMTLAPVLDTDQPVKGLLFLAAGSGITPFMALTQALAQKQWPVPVTLMYWAQTPEALVQHSVFEAMAQASEGQFTYLPIVESGADQLNGALQGRPSQEQFAASNLALADQQVYACGPDGFMKAIRSLVEEQVAGFHAESFTPGVLIADDAEVREVEVTLTRTNRVVKVPSNQPLLKALQAQGINPAHGCGMGICNTCSCTKSTGTTRDLQNSAVCSKEGAAVRICVSAAQSACSLDL